jgi:SAM-dependent methyltransferase
MRDIDPDEAWQAIGEIDPYFGVYSKERFHRGQWNEHAKADFFNSGEDYVATLFDIVRSQLVGSFRPKRALDFGCGVARLVIPLAKQCDHVVAVDISNGMLDESRKNCKDCEVTNVDFVLSDETLVPVSGTFDFVHSFIVLQHLPAPRGMMLMDRLIDRLDRGGVGVIHLTYARRASSLRKLLHWARQRIPFVNAAVNVIQGHSPFAPTMQMNTYDLNSVFQRLQDRRCHNVLLRFSDHGGWFGLFLMFEKQPLTDFEML